MIGATRESLHSASETQVDGGPVERSCFDFPSRFRAFFSTVIPDFAAIPILTVVPDSCHN